MKYLILAYGAEEDWKAFLAVAQPPMSWLRDKSPETTPQVETRRKAEQLHK